MPFLYLPGCYDWCGEQHHQQQRHQQHHQASVSALLALVGGQGKLSASVMGAKDDLKALVADKDAKGAEQAAALLKLLK